MAANILVYNKGSTLLCNCSQYQIFRIEMVYQHAVQEDTVTEKHKDRER